MIKISFILASLFAMLAIMLGAFGAHGLRGALEPLQLITFETGVRYQFYHALALFVVGFLLQSKNSKFLNAAIWCFSLGIVLFSGSIYLLACRDVLGIENWTWLGPVTPLGGLFLIIGWLFVLISQLRR